MSRFFRSHRRSMLLSWLSVLVLVTSVFSWLPAAAQDATPTPDPAAEQVQTTTEDDSTVTTQTETQDETLDEGTGEESQDINTTDAPVEITLLSIACGAIGGTSLVGSLTVANPQDGVTVELSLLAGTSELDGDDIDLNAAQTDYPFEFTLEPADVTLGSSVVVTALEEGSDAAPITSSAVAISAGTEGGTVCGAVAPEDDTTDPGQTIDDSTPTPTQTPASGVTPTPTQTPSASPTPSATPVPFPVERLVALLVEILEEAISNTPSLPSPTEPPPSSGGDDDTRTATVSGTGGAGLRCRTAPGNGDVIVVLPEGSRVETRGASSDGWAPVRCGGQNGWVSIAYLFFGASGGGSGELWIDIDLTDQYMRVYRGDEVIMGTYVSTGRVPKFTTPTGTFYINTKLRSQTMSGTLQGESYHVPNVPWVMYFTNRGHAIHGAYWHNNFGTEMSHGCVNLPVSTAEWLYSVSSIGTRVVIHY